MRLFSALFMMLLVAGCSLPTPEVAPPEQAPTATTAQTRTPSRVSPNVAARNFVAVVQRVEPIAEAECRRRLQGANCDFKIVVDDRANQPPNAFQTVDRSGRPIIGFTISLIADARNPDELAFILGHEAAHHIRKHLPRTQASAQTGALILGTLAQIGGGDGAVVQEAARIGAAVGSRRYSKEFELEADALGTVIAKKAGYNPVLGSQFFNRIPDPGDKFLGTHPPNKERLEIVRRVNSQL